MIKSFVCGFGAKSESGLKRHIASTHDKCGGIFTCDQCEYKAKLKSDKNTYEVKA